MLPDADIEKLCHGRIIYATVPRSDGRDSAGPHWAVILDSDAEIEQHDTYYVVVISNDDQIDPFRLPVFPRVGLTGYFQCSWQVLVDLPGITKIGAKLEVPEMVRLLEMVRQANKARAEKIKAQKSQRPSTQS
jgi:hypothetical protein